MSTKWNVISFMLLLLIAGVFVDTQIPRTLMVVAKDGKEEAKEANEELEDADDNDLVLEDIDDQVEIQGITLEELEIKLIKNKLKILQDKKTQLQHKIRNKVTEQELDCKIQIVNKTIADENQDNSSQEQQTNQPKIKSEEANLTKNSSDTMSEKKSGKKGPKNEMSSGRDRQRLLMKGDVKHATTQDNIHKYLSKNLQRGNINAVKMKSLGWLEKQSVYSTEKTQITHFDYLHVRIKPQSTMYYRVSATTNPKAHYVVVTVSTDNILRIFESLTKIQEPFQNNRQLMSLNLTEEGVCSDSNEILTLQTQKTAATSYKRNNEDLRPDDRPFVTVFLRNGRYHHYQLAVIDRHQSLMAYKGRQPNQTRYLYSSQTPNYPVRPDGSNRGVELKLLRGEYRKPEIRVEQIIESDLIEQVNRNMTIIHCPPGSTDQEIEEIQKELNLPLQFINGDHVSIRGKKYLMSLDRLGYAYYFFSRDYRKFFYTGRVWVGGVLPEDGNGQDLVESIKDKDVRANAKAAIDPVVKKVLNFGFYGYFTIFQSYFGYSKHLESFNLDSHICVPGFNMFNSDLNNGIKVIAADVSISGLVYVMPESGDQINLFMIEIQSAAAAGSKKRSGKTVKSAQSRYGFASGSDCQMVGNIKLKDLNKQLGPSDRLEQLMSVRGQLVIISQQGRVFTMEVLNLEQILIQPIFDELKINFRTFIDASPIMQNEIINKQLLMVQVKKSTAEQNNEKGSQNLLLLPLNHRDMNGHSTTSLVSFDYSPMPSKSKLFQSFYKPAPVPFNLESLRNFASYFHQIGQIGLMDDSGTSSIGYKTSLTISSDSTFSNLMNASKEEASRGNWTIVNYLLGIIAFCMFAYLIKTMQKTRSNAKGSSPFGQGGKFAGMSRQGGAGAGAGGARPGRFGGGAAKFGGGGGGGKFGGGMGRKR